jgi:hypothetical protein
MPLYKPVPPMPVPAYLTLFSLSLPYLTPCQKLAAEPVVLPEIIF